MSEIPMSPGIDAAGGALRVTFTPATDEARQAVEQRVHDQVRAAVTQAVEPFQHEFAAFRQAKADLAAAYEKLRTIREQYGVGMFPRPGQSREQARQQWAEAEAALADLGPRCFEAEQAAGQTLKSVRFSVDRADDLRARVQALNRQVTEAVSAALRTVPAALLADYVIATRALSAMTSPQGVQEMAVEILGAGPAPQPPELPGLIVSSACLAKA